MNWGYRIIILYALFMTGILFMVYKCTQQKVDLVTDKYYEREVKYQDQYNSMMSSNEVKNHATISLNTDKSSILISYPEIANRNEVKGSFYFFKPDNSNLDFSVEVLPDKNNIQQIATSNLSKGWWRIQMSWILNNAKLYQEEKIYIQ